MARQRRSDGRLSVGLHGSLMMPMQGVFKTASSPGPGRLHGHRALLVKRMQRSLKAALMSLLASRLRVKNF